MENIAFILENTTMACKGDVLVKKRLVAQITYNCASYSLGIAQSTYNIARPVISLLYFEV